jgi:[protein-PII] uridylyltransferase
MATSLDRDHLLSSTDLAGARWCRASSDLVDEWLRELFTAEVDAAGTTEAGPTGVALLAVGGYGRAELSPQSDIDVLLLHAPRRDMAPVAARLWYPIWDEGLKLGHAVRTVKEALALAADDLDTATSLLSARLLAGDEGLATELTEKANALWRKRSKRWLAELDRTVRERHDRAGEVAFLLEPDLKDGRGGLRDVHAIRWAERAERVMLEGDDAALAEAYETLLSARVELHRRTGRPGDRLLLEEQDAVASALAYADADEMMRCLSAAARRIAWTSDELWQRVRSSLRGPRNLRLSRDKPLAPGVVLREGEVHLEATAAPGDDPTLALRVAAAAAAQDARIERRSLNRLADEAPELPDPWPDEARRLFVELLLAGRPAIHVVEALDQKGVWARILPEWGAVRCKPQRNAYHTFTVDRHLAEAAANAAGLVDRVDRPDLLVVGALFHDIGKGYPGDHTEVGIEVLGRLGPRMGFPPDDVAVLQEIVRHHLLLPDVATRRDLDDDGTLRHVAAMVATPSVLRLLHALTVADSTATGPAAWNTWKAGLVAELVARTSHVLGGGAVEDVTTESFPPADVVARMAERRRVVETTDDRLTVISPDRPGLFAQVAGALALNGLDVIEANAYSDDVGMAVETFRVESSFGPIVSWDKVVADVERALDGRLALRARLAERARVYARPSYVPTMNVEPSVLVDNALSSSSTVVEVRAPDAVGLLYRITGAIAEMDLDIHSAKVATLGDDVVDSFYVRDRDGRKVIDPDHLAELERAILSALSG